MPHRLEREDGLVIVRSLELATSLAARVLGLLGRTSMPDGAGLLLRPCHSIHTLFMKISIDVAFLDKSGAVTAIHRSLKPGRPLVKGPSGTVATLEMGAGALPVDLRVGDRLRLLEGQAPA